MWLKTSWKIIWKSWDVLSQSQDSLHFLCGNRECIIPKINESDKRGGSCGSCGWRSDEPKCLPWYKPRSFVSFFHDYLHQLGFFYRALPSMCVMRKWLQQTQPQALSLSLSPSLRKLECSYCIMYNLLIPMFRKKEREREQERERQIEKRGTEKERPSWCGVVRRRETEAESSLSEHSSLWGLSR